MIDLKDLVNDLGGGKSIGLGAVLLAWVFVAANQYFENDTQEKASIRAAIEELKQRQNKDDVFHGNGSRYTAVEGRALERRVERLERFHE